jgi:flagellar basal-body rod protein FlgB
MSFLKALEDEYRFLSDALNLRAGRQQLIASNIANADTPGFKAKDLDFAAALKAVEEQRNPAVNLNTTHAGHIAGKPADPLAKNTRYRQGGQDNIDGNTVNMDTERTQFTENALHYQFVADRISDETQEFLQAIKTNG